MDGNLCRTGISLSGDYAFLDFCDGTSTDGGDCSDVELPRLLSSVLTSNLFEAFNPPGIGTMPVTTSASAVEAAVAPRPDQCEERPRHTCGLLNTLDDLLGGFSDDDSTDGPTQSRKQDCALAPGATEAIIPNPGALAGAAGMSLRSFARQKLREAESRDSTSPKLLAAVSHDESLAPPDFYCCQEPSITQQVVPLTKSALAACAPGQLQAPKPVRRPLSVSSLNLSNRERRTVERRTGERRSSIGSSGQSSESGTSNMMRLNFAHFSSAPPKRSSCSGNNIERGSIKRRRSQSMYAIREPCWESEGVEEGDLSDQILEEWDAHYARGRESPRVADSTWQ